ncbi:UNVERIFIED_ORG: LytTR family DNA-binding domain-containing protein [Shinella sp. XGS7]|nr:LytTR family DNA-binding domain-containing protein [Shinella sp. XGS7]
MSLPRPAATALIAEDEPLLAEALRAELQQLWPELTLLPAVGHGQAAVDTALARRPQILFLDIRMPGMSGLEAAAALAEDWPQDQPFPLLVFVTAYDQYALQAFERAAIDYVLKPVQRERLTQSCERLQAALRQREPAPAEGAVQQLRQLLEAPALAQALGLATNAAAAAPAATPLRLLQVGVGSSIVMLPVDEVIYFEAADKYVRVLTAEREYLVRISLRELLPQLDGQRFWQVHRSLVVRSDAIARAERDEASRLSLVLHERPERLGVSRLYAHLFKAL